MDKKDVQEAVDFVTDVTDPATITKKIEELQQELRRYNNYRYNLLLYKIIKSGKISTVDLSEITGHSRMHLYNITDIFDKKLKEKNG